MFYNEKNVAKVFKNHTAIFKLFKIATPLLEPPSQVEGKFQSRCQDFWPQLTSGPQTHDKGNQREDVINLNL